MSSPYGLAVDSANNIYIADYGDFLIRKVNPSGTISTVAGNYPLGVGYSGDGGLATNAQIGAPEGVAVDSSGNIYIGDTDYDTVREVNAGSGVITSISGWYTSGFSQPNGIALDGLESLCCG